MSAKRRGTKQAAAMTPEEAFLQAIHANITDPAPWQLYADWLEERGDPRAVYYRERRGSNSLGMEFVTVPTGTYTMGGGGCKQGTERYTIPEFQMGAHPVTQGQWGTLIGHNPSHFSRGGAGACRIQDVSDEDLRKFPVETVSLDDAQRFIERLNEREAIEGWWYRLPNTSEWEYACRGAAISRKECSFHFYAGEPANSIASGQANFNGRTLRGSTARGPYLERTTRVDAYPANRLGIYGMHGNVWEWLEYNFLDAVGLGVAGGGWNDFGEFCSASHRHFVDPKGQYSDVGFRLARSSIR